MGNNGNGSKPVIINQIHDENPDHIEAIKGNGYRPQKMVIPTTTTPSTKQKKESSKMLSL
jgi:hypothetical protein